MWKVAANTITLVTSIPGLSEVRNKGFVRNDAKKKYPVNQRANDIKFPVRAGIQFSSVQFSSVQSLSRVQLFATP